MKLNKNEIMPKEKLSSIPKRPAIDLQNYLEKQKNLILSPENLRAAESFFRHQPNWVEHKLARNELAQYFIKSGQAKQFEKEYKNHFKPNQDKDLNELL